MDYRRSSVLSGARAALAALFFGFAAFAVAAEQPPTRATGPGPEYTGDAPATAQLWRDGDPGQRLHLRGRVVSTTGSPIDGAEVLLWQADGAGSYHEDRYRARLIANERGEFSVTSALPGQYYGVKHIHVMISHPAYRSLTSRILFRGDPNLPPEDEDLAVLLEEVRMEDRSVLVGDVQFVLAPR
jgi:protocatechuate 3,4-dioxygenase beta subunit